MAPAPATTPEHVRHFGSLRPPGAPHRPLTLKTIVVHQLNEYRNMTMLLYIHSLELTVKKLHRRLG